MRKNGVDIPGAISPTLAIGSVTMEDEGVYDCVVGGSQCCVTSDAATLTVTACVVDTPTFSPSGGTLPDPVEVTISCGTDGAVIHYTTSGYDPTETNPAIASGSSFLVAVSTTLKARAFKPGMNASSVKSAHYEIGNYTGDMIYIPARSFLMGNNGSEPYSCSNELPQHSVNLSGFWIGKYEVIRGEYQAFINAPNPRLPVVGADLVGLKGRFYWMSALVRGFVLSHHCILRRLSHTIVCSVFPPPSFCPFLWPERVIWPFPPGFVR